MSIIDFFIGFTLMNAMPHFVLGVWGGRILGGLGFGNTANILYGLINFCVSIGLFVYEYGVRGLWNNGIYLGALTILLIYFVTARFLHAIFTRNQA